MTELAQRVALRVLPYGAGELELVLAAVAYYRRTVMRRGAIRGCVTALSSTPRFLIRRHAG